MPWNRETLCTNNTVNRESVLKSYQVPYFILTINLPDSVLDLCLFPQEIKPLAAIHRGDVILFANPHMFFMHNLRY